MEIKPKDLKSLFINDTQLAIDYCKVVISTTSKFETFQEFSDYHSKNSHISTCQNAWSEAVLSIHCPECGVDESSCICLQCFLNGNHQGHDYFICQYSSGNCDCGDISSWKRSGFCTHHHGLEPDSHPEDYLDEELRILLTDIVFKGSLGAITKIDPNDISTLSMILQFLKIFLNFGDGFRRLLSISLTEKINFEKFFNHIFDFSLEFNHELKVFFGLLVNDELFKKNFSRLNYKLIVNKITPLEISVAKGSDPEVLKNISPWKNFWFHSYSNNIMQTISKSDNWNWINFIMQILTYMKELFTLKGSEVFNYTYTPYIFFQITNLAYFVRTQPDDQRQILFDKLFTEILSKGSIEGINKNVNDMVVTTTFNTDLPQNYFAFVFSFDSNFFNFTRAFSKCENLKFDEMFKTLDKLFDISQIFLIGKNVIENGIVNDNERLVYNFVTTSTLNHSLENDNDYKSFQNGASFYVSCPLFYTLAYMLRNDDSCRIKIAEFLSRNEYQNLRVRLGIATLKNLLSMVCLSQSLVPKTNEAINYYLSSYVNDPTKARCGIPLLLPLLQLTIGIRCNENKGVNEFSFKEFFAFEMAREIGIFDDLKNDFNEGNKKQMIFSFLYLTLLLVTERILFNFDGFKFCKEQIIFELKQGVSDLNELSKLYDDKVNENASSFVLMNKIIQEVATPRQNSKKGSNENFDSDVSFDLKEGVEVNFISAINSFNREKVLMNNEISKHPDTLIKMQQFEPEESYFFNSSENINVQLKEFLITPTVFAIVYRTLRKSSESHTNELNDHLAMNILILISKFVSDSNFRSDSSVRPKTRPFKNITYKLSIVELITQLQRYVFNYTRDLRGSSSIQNTITKESFELLLNLKICSSNESPKSLIDILLEKGELGKTVLTQIGVKIAGDENDKNKKDTNQKKKDRARKLKEDIMTLFKTKSSNFTFDDEQNDEALEQTNAEKDVCSICSLETKDEILCYPLYIYRTKFPFIFDKPPLVQMTQLNSLKEADIYQDEDILETTRLKSDNDSDEDDEAVPDPDALFATFLNQVPNLDLNDEMDDNSAQLIRNSFEVIHQAILVTHGEMVQKAEDKKNRRKQMRLQQFQRDKNEAIRRQNELQNPNSIVSKRCTAGNIFVIQFGICQHLVHPNCVQQENFTCPIDRSYKNGFLPNIDDLSDDVIYADRSTEKLSDKMNETLSVFINKYSRFFKASEDKIVDVFVELVKSISGLIVTFEVRLRSLPDCLDSKKTKVLARNLFLTAWHAYRMKGKPKMKTGFTEDVSEDVDSKMTVFQRFIKKLIESDEIEKNREKFDELVSSFVTSSFSDNCGFDEEKEKCLFLRRVCLADHFLLKKSSSFKNHDIIDWDEILSSENLSQKFNVHFDHLPVEGEFEFKPFLFTKLPHEFLRLAQEPYSFPVELVSQFTVFNILDYNSLISSGENAEDIDYLNQLLVLGDDERKVNSVIRKLFARKNYPSVLLFVGKMASRVCIVDGRRMCLMRPFYLDRYGCTDIGYSRSQPLFLNEERYERVMDQVLSGEFTNNLKPY